MIEIYNNTSLNLKEIPKEDYEREYKRERVVIEQERKYDSKRLQQVENDIMKMSLYDF